jgi:hypothetical protein
MANRTFNDVRSAVKELVVIPMTLSILGNTTPANGTFSVVKGAEHVASVARTGVGAYRVTLKDSYPDAIGGSIDMYGHNGAARQARIVSINVASKQINFQIMTEALVAGETPNGETDTVRLTIFAKNTTVPR